MEEDDAPQPQIVTREQLNRELREAAKHGVRAIDPHDVSWVEPQDDDDENMEDLTVREVSSSHKAVLRVQGKSEVDEEALKEQYRLAQLGDPKANRAKDEKRATAAFASNKAGSAITGHGAARRLAPAADGSSRKGKQSVTRTASILSKVSTKKGGFGA